MKKNLLVLDRTGYSHFRDASGRPFISPEEYDVYLMTTGKVAKESLPEERCWQQSVDFRDEDAIIELARGIHEKAPLHRVIATAEDELILAARIREACGIPGMREHQVLPFRDKCLMKEILGAAGVRVPAFKRLGSLDEIRSFLERYRKIVLKPVSGIGSAATFVVSSPDELERILETGAVTAEQYEVEEFIDGEMHHVDSVIRNGRPVLVSISRYLAPTLDYQQGEPLGAVMLDPDSATHRSIVAFQERVFRALEVDSGVTHHELFVTRDGEVVFCEIALRPGGGGAVPSVAAAYGVNLYQAYVDIELGHTEDGLAGAPAERLSGYIIFPPIDGTVKGMPAAEELADPWIVDKQINVKVGTSMKANSCCSENTGMFVITGSSEAELMDRIGSIRQRFRLEVTNNASSCCG